MKPSAKSAHDTLIIKPGAVLRPGVVFRIFEDGAHGFADTKDLFANKRSVVFMGPAPFSKLDKQQAIEYEELSAEILKYVDVIYGIYCQDAFVMRLFEDHIHTEAGSKNVQFWADGDGTFSRLNALLHDFTNMGLGSRSGRWCFILDNGEVEYIACDDFKELDVTSADDLLQSLKEDSEA